MKKNLLALILTLNFILPSFVFAQTATKSASPARKASENITAAQMKDYLYFIASDEMEGRDTPSRGLDTTAKFIATMLSRWGFKPAGDDGSFFQKIALRRDSVDVNKTSLEIGNTKAVLNEDFFRLAGSTDSAVNGPLVFVKDGWFIKSKNIDAFQGIDVKGKTLVLYGNSLGRNMMTTFPTGVTQADLKGEKGVDWADPVTYARQNGANGIILIASPDAQGIWDRIKQSFLRGGVGLYPEKLRETGRASNNLPVMFVSQKVGEAIFGGEEKNPLTTANTPAFDLKKTAKISVASKSEVVYTQNVVALWEGSDPVLKNEMVAVGAHYDHVGINPNAKGSDKIWNGADDDGSGTTAVLAMAEALAKSPKRPKRSILFVWHAGEEKGLWGSEYFTKFPTVDITKVIAHLNIDMIGRSKKLGDANPKNVNLTGETEIYVIGSKMMSSELGSITESVNNSFLKLNYNYKYDDPKDKERFFFRSDHFNYAIKGIPIVFWFDGVHEDYHGVGDHADKIDYPKMEKVTRTIFLTMWELADLKARPAVDKKLPAELMQR